MNNVFKTIVLSICVALVSLAFVACGDTSSIIGSDPVLPSYSQNAPANDEGLKATLTSNGYSAFFGGIGVVYSIKSAGGITSTFVGINTATYDTTNTYAALANSLKQSFATYNSLLASNKAQLEKTLTDAGFTHFNITATAMSYKTASLEYSLVIHGTWILVEMKTVS